MEALELYREETRKLEEHKYMCQSAEKEVETPSLCCLQPQEKKDGDKKFSFGLQVRFMSRF